VNLADHRCCHLNDFVVVFRDKTFITVSYSEDAFDTIPVVELVDEAAYDVVKAGAEAAAGYYADFRFCRFEVYHLFGTGLLE